MFTDQEDKLIYVRKKPQMILMCGTGLGGETFSQYEKQKRGEKYVLLLLLYYYLLLSSSTVLKRLCVVGHMSYE